MFDRDISQDISEKDYFEGMAMADAKEKLAKFGAIIFRDYVTYNNGYLDFADEAYQFLKSLKNYPGIKETVEELTRE